METTFLYIALGKWESAIRYCGGDYGGCIVIGRSWRGFGGCSGMYS